jgi:ribonuclease T
MSETPPPYAATDAASAPAAPTPAPPLMVRRFRGFLPVVVDVETGGFQPGTDALLQIAAVLIDIDPNGRLHRGETHSFHVRPFENSRLDPASLLVNKIDPWHPLRPAIDESDALQRIFRAVRSAIRSHGCRRAVLVGHNAAFDLAFLNAALLRTGIKRNPFHPFSCFDTATLAGAALGQTVLAKALAVAGLPWDKASAHSATYDAERTADLFCLICNELADSYARAEQRARLLGWQELAASAPEPEDEPGTEPGDDALT